MNNAGQRPVLWGPGYFLVFFKKREDRLGDLVVFCPTRIGAVLAYWGIVWLFIQQDRMANLRAFAHEIEMGGACGFEVGRNLFGEIGDQITGF